jgi:aquaporin Z
MKKFITEFIGAFFLVLVVGLAGTMTPGFAPIAIGSILMVMVYAGGHISGGHYNPAVTLSVLIRGKISVSDAAVYMVFQIAGAAAAALAVMKVFHAGGTGASAILDGSVKRALAAEAAGTFALAYVVLNVATAKNNIGNDHYGISVGFTVASMAYALGSFSGGAFNPAVAVGQMIGGHMAWADIWIYLVGCFGGAALAALVFRFNNVEDK